MTDMPAERAGADSDLIARLMDLGVKSAYIAATRIRELNEASTAKDAEIASLRAKLEKAVETLKFYAPQDAAGVTFAGGDDAGQRARATLSEITHD